jgi:hypothetical protein
MCAWCKFYADRDNSFSVGSTTTQRQIINVATPTQATDAANKGYVILLLQLFQQQWQVITLPVVQLILL